MPCHIINLPSVVDFSMNVLHTFAHHFIPALILLLHWPAIGSAQDCIGRNQTPPKVHKYLRKASRHLSRNDLQRALRQAQKARSRCPNCQEVHAFYADLYLRRNEWIKALPHLEFLSHCPDAAPSWQYALLEAYWHTNAFAEALSLADDLLQSARSMSASTRRRIQKIRRDAQFWLRNRPDSIAETIRVIRLPRHINSHGIESFPVLGLDRQTLYFTRRQGPAEYLHYTVRKDSSWGAVQRLFPPNVPFTQGAYTISPDGKLLIFSSCTPHRGLGSCDLYSITRTRDGQWSKPHNLGPPINTSAWESHPCLAHNGQALYFASNRSGGLGGKDLWVSYRLPNGKWSVPQNLGPHINTPEDDFAPFVHPDDSTLYFSSYGHPGMGDVDIFVSRRDSTGAWSVPINLGPPFNTKGHDACLSVDWSGQEAYFISDRADFSSYEMLGHTDIFRASPLPPRVRPKPVTYFHFITRSADDTPLSGVTIALYLTDENHPYLTTHSDAEGQAWVFVPYAHQYAIHIGHPGYVFVSDSVRLPLPDTASNFYTLRYTLTPLSEIPFDSSHRQRPIVLKNLYFAYNSDTLDTRSHFELDSIAAFLCRNPRLMAEVSGHTDSVGSYAYNMELSLRRAQAVCAYLIRRAPCSLQHRLRCRGYGFTRPLTDNTTPEGRARNRRVELHLWRSKR